VETHPIVRGILMNCAGSPGVIVMPIAQNPPGIARHPDIVEVKALPQNPILE